MSGFTSAAALIIGANQITNLLGIEIPQNNQLHKLIYSLSDAFEAIHIPTLLLGIGSMRFSWYFLIQRQDTSACNFSGG